MNDSGPRAPFSSTRTVAARPWRRRPAGVSTRSSVPRITPIRSQRRSASSRLWVQTTIERPRARRVATKSRTVLAAEGSRPLVGSSR